MSDPTPVFDDLREESEELDRLVAELSAEQWALATPAPGWSVAHQIGHLAWTDHSALLAATDTDAFHVLVEKALVSPGSFVDDGAEEDRYAGTYLGKRELRALVANPRLQVYEDPKAFLTCWGWTARRWRGGVPGSYATGWTGCLTNRAPGSRALSPMPRWKRWWCARSKRCPRVRPTGRSGSWPGGWGSHRRACCGSGGRSGCSPGARKLSRSLRTRC